MESGTRSHYQIISSTSRFRIPVYKVLMLTLLLVLPLSITLTSIIKLNSTLPNLTTIYSINSYFLPQAKLLAYVRANNVSIPDGAANIRIFRKEGPSQDGASCRVFMSDEASGEMEEEVE